MAVKLSPADAAAKWGRNLKGATEDIRKGIQGVTESPSAAAADKIDKLRANLVEAIDDGTMENALRNVSLSDWKSKVLDKGIGRISAGVDGSQDKVKNFYSDLFSHIESVQGQLDGMPDVTLEDNISRMTTFIRGMAEFTKGR